MGDEIRAPDTLVDAIFYATADAGSIPAVSTGCSGCESHRLRPLQAFCSAKVRSVRTKDCRNLRATREWVGRKSAASVASVGHKAPVDLGARPGGASHGVRVTTKSGQLQASLQDRSTAPARDGAA